MRQEKIDSCVAFLMMAYLHAADFVAQSSLRSSSIFKLAPLYVALLSS